MILAAAPSPLTPLLFFSSPRPSAGFPSPAADFVEGQLDLNRFLVKRPASTFIVKISGNSLDRAGIHNGDLAVVDRSLQASSGDIVVVVLYGELLVKRLRYAGGQPILEPDSSDSSYEPFAVLSGADFEIWGVVTNTIRQHRV